MQKRRFTLIHIYLIFSLCASCTNSESVKDSSSLTVEQLLATPLFENVFADPTVVFDAKEHKFYAYGTEDDWSDVKNSRLVPILESTNLTDWTYAGEAFPQKPTWKKDG